MRKITVANEIIDNLHAMKLAQKLGKEIQSNLRNRVSFTWNRDNTMDGSEESWRSGVLSHTEQISQHTGS